jgi:hypothetical protein
MLATTSRPRTSHRCWITALFSRELLDLTLAQLNARPVMVVMLAPGLKVCQDRNAARDDDERLDFDYSPLEEELEREVGGVGW